MKKYLAVAYRDARTAGAAEEIERDVMSFLIEKLGLPTSIFGELAMPGGNRPVTRSRWFPWRGSGAVCSLGGEYISLKTQDRVKMSALL